MANDLRVIETQTQRIITAITGVLLGAEYFFLSSTSYMFFIILLLIIAFFINSYFGRITLIGLIAFLASASTLYILGSFSIGSSNLSPGSAVQGLYLACITLFCYLLSTHFFLGSAISLAFFSLVFISIFSGIKDGFTPETFDNIHEGKSRNAFSFYLLSFGSAYTAYYFQKYQKTTIWPALFCLLIALVSGTRGPIISALLLLAGSFLCVYIFSRKKLLLSALFLVFSLCALYYFSDSLLTLYNTTKFSESGLESPRWDIWNAYISSLNTQSIIFGLNLETVPLIKEHNTNPHSVFIAAHSKYGLLSIITLTFILLYSILNIFKKTTILPAICTMVILVRFSTDINALGHATDFALIATLLITQTQRDRQLGIP